MRRPDQDEQDSSRTSPSQGLASMASVCIMVAVFLGMLMVLQLDVLRPGVGDMIVFAPDTQDANPAHRQIPASMVTQAGGFIRTCALDADIIAVAGGSLVVEGRQDGVSEPYLVRWAGARTTSTTSDCGNEALLTVSRVDLQRLANYAGGFGVGNKGMTR